MPLSDLLAVFLFPVFSLTDLLLSEVACVLTTGFVSTCCSGAVCGLGVGLGVACAGLVVDGADEGVVGALLAGIEFPGLLALASR